jgi:prophage regulatory protein
MREGSEEEPRESQPPPRLIRLKEVQHRVGLGRSTIYKRMSDGGFPKSRSLGSKCTVWVESEIDEWIQLVSVQN